MQTLKCEEVKRNFVALFLIDYKEENFYEQIVGIWKPSNQPMIIQCEHPYHYIPIYSLVKNLTFNEVDDYARKSADTTSVFSKHFFGISRSNWMELLKNALLSVRQKYIDLGFDVEEFHFENVENRLYTYMSNEDGFFHRNKDSF